jgi:hypothetical protein
LGNIRSHAPQPNSNAIKPIAPHVRRRSFIGPGRREFSLDVEDITGVQRCPPMAESVNWQKKLPEQTFLFSSVVFSFCRLRWRNFSRCGL